MNTHIRYFFALGLVALGLLLGSLSPARAGVFINVGIAPPPLPVCVQPACPGLGYIWTPGYWAWDAVLDDYYWVPGTWCYPPEIGFLWTPAWWGCDNGVYTFHDGYWGRGVGFYGGIAYGNGYSGNGYDGGYWRGSHFLYNRSVNNVAGIERSRTFNRSVAENNSRVSFNGGPGGTTARATAAELRAARGTHIAATSAQRAQVRAAAADPSLRNSVNHGQPAVTGTSRAGEIRPSATGASHQPVTESNANRPAGGLGESAFTGERHVAAESHVSRASGESAFTGERHVAAESHVSRASGESAFTGERHVAAESHVSRASGESAFTGERSQRHFAATESHHAYRTRTEAATRSAFTESHVSAPRFHEQSFHEQAFRPSAHMGGFHAESHGSAGRVGGGGPQHR